MSALDLLLVADPRLPPAEARSLVALVEAVVARGGTAGLVPVRGAFAARNRRFDPRVRRAIERGHLAWIDTDQPLDVRLLLGWHLPAFLHVADRRLAVTAADRILRLDHPAVLADGRQMFDAGAVVAQAAEFMAGAVRLVCSDPLVRAGLPSEVAAACSSDVLPPPVASFGSASAGGKAACVGRHDAVGGLAWPSRLDDLLQAYPAEQGLQVRIAGSMQPQALDGMPMPAGWEWRPDPGDGIASWLAGLDAWVLHTHETLRHPLTASLAEALAAGRPIVGANELQPILGDALVPTDPAGTAVTLADLPRKAGAAALVLARSQLDAGPIAASLLPKLGPAAARSASAPYRLPRRSRRRVLFLSPNGIGMGHLTRQLAVARRLPASIEPVFLTMSQAVAVVGEQGFIAEYTPYHAAYGGHADPWNEALTQRLGEMIGFYDARLILFDGNVPYQALVSARKLFPERHWMWVRRGMWRAQAGRDAIARGRHFDVIVEPGEFAARYDQGLTAQRGNEAVHVAPITLLDAAERLDREAARAQLGLRSDTTAVLVALGSGNNYDMASSRRDVLQHLAKRADVEVVVATWLIADERADVLPEGVRRLRAYPYASLLAAFDFAISAVGYNSFHELIECRLPTVFVPNENPMMDDQERRGLWAERHGVGLLARTSDPYRLRWAVDRLLQPEIRAAMRDARMDLPACSGAAEVAAIIEELTAGVHARRERDPLTGLLTRAA